MNIPDIPFNKHNGIHKTEKGILSLSYSEAMTNHLGTIHAGAQFALAEACSGQFLFDQFPEYHEGHVAVLRKSDTKYKNQTKSDIFASASVEDEAIQSCRHNLTKKNRAFIPIQVTIKDKEQKTTMVGTFEWYIQAIEERRSNKAL